jgi:hypothetical protein
MPKYLPLLIACIVAFPALAQEDPTIKAIAIQMAENLPEAEDLSELTERLSNYKTHPIDLNQTNPAQLKELAFLSALQISNFFSHIRQNGKLKELVELQAIADFDLETINKLLPFVTLTADNVYQKLNAKQLRNHGTNELLLRYGQLFEQQKGYKALPGSHYLGSPAKVLLKYKYNLNDLVAFSLTGEKDAGETFFKAGSKMGFDFLSASLQLGKLGQLKRVVIGDYSLQFGQGLSLWSGTSLGKGPDVAGVAKRDTHLKAYTSANEYSFFRGIAGTLPVFRKIELHSFISYRRLDASLNEGEDGSLSLSTISSSGLHRTPTESKHKGNLGQLLYGIAMEMEHQELSVGITLYHTRFSENFVTGTARYKRYNFEGRALTNTGFHYNYTFKNVYFFAEAAQSFPGGLAALQGAMASLTTSSSVVLVYRNYSKEHHSFYGQAMGLSDAANEQGIYLGVNTRPMRKIEFSFYADRAHFPWLKYRVDEPSSAFELSGQLRYIPNKKLKVTLKVSSVNTAQNESSGLAVNPVAKVQKDNRRLSLDWKVNKQLTLQNRVEMTTYKKGKKAAESGCLIYQDLDYKPMSSRLAGNLRIAWFNTPSYDSRIYAYEDDVLYGSGSGLYNGKGIRTFLNLNFRATRQLRVWVRYAMYLYPGRATIGTGLDEIKGSKKSDIKLQLRYQF